MFRWQSNHEIVHVVFQVTTSAFIQKCTVPLIFDPHLSSQLDKVVYGVDAIALEHIKHLASARATF